MKRFVARLSVCLLLALGIAGTALPAYAATDPFKGVPCNKASSSAVCQTDTDDPFTGPDGILQKTATLIAIIGGVFAVIMMVLAGITYITSNGDNEQIAKAKRTLIFSAIGLAVLLMGRFLVGWVITLI